MSTADKWLFRSNYLFLVLVLLVVPNDIPSSGLYDIVPKITLFSFDWIAKTKNPFFKIVTYLGFQVINTVWGIYFLVHTPTWLKGSKAYYPSLLQVVFVGVSAVFVTFLHPAATQCRECFLSVRWIYAFFFTSKHFFIRSFFCGAK